MWNARPRASGRSGERGAALLQMTIAMLAITAFSTFVMDYGVFWVARRQAQNSADAGALAAALALAFEDPGTLGAAGPALLSGRVMAQANAIWGEAPSITLTDGADSDVRVIDCPDGSINRCVRTDVFRSSARGNPLPTYFGRLAEIDTQDVQATATAEVMSANETNCAQHWGIADRWADAAWNTGSLMWTATDVYTPPTATLPGTGLQVADGTGQFCCDYGRGLTLQNQDRRLARFYGRLDVGGGGCDEGVLDGPPNRVRRNLFTSTTVAINALVDADPDACWSLDPGCGQGLAARCPDGCVYSPLHGVNASPRIVVVRSYDPGQVADLAGTFPTSAQVNLVALFIEGHIDASRNLPVRVIVAPAAYNPSRPTLTAEASFLRTAVLVR